MRNVIIDTNNSKHKDKILLTAVVNSGMLDYTFNWIESLKKTNQDDCFLVFAIDEGVSETLTERGYGGQVTLIPEDWFHVPLSSDFSRWKTNAYRPITHAKTLIVERLLYLDITVWFSDVDIVLLDEHVRDVMLFQMNERPNTDMIFSQEVDQRTVNSGFYMMRPTYQSKQLMHYIISEQDKTTLFTQQKIMNGVLRSMFGRDLQKSPYRLLDMLLFPNGKYYFRLDLPYKLGIKPMMVHANYIVGDKKRESLKAKDLWYIEEDE
ncbi:glycosyltransferase family 77 protein [Backusella circina FSU 941]|nr:glycosyltransferase family 77 protein [Backusella circina FSU 941]